MLGYMHHLPELVLAAQDDLDDWFCRAMSANNLEGAMACFWDSADLVVVLWGTVLRGSEAVRAAVAHFFEQHESIRLDVNDCTHIPAGGAVIAAGTATYSFRGRAGIEKRIIQRQTDLRRQVDGRWVYVPHHESAVEESHGSTHIAASDAVTAPCRTVTGVPRRIHHEDKSRPDCLGSRTEQHYRRGARLRQRLHAGRHLVRWR